MTSFRRLVIGITEWMAVISILLSTLIGGSFGAALGTLEPRIFGMISHVDVNVQGVGQVATLGGVIGFVAGALVGFVMSSQLAGMLFAFAQIERNTRSLLERQEPYYGDAEYERTAPRF
jgi:hypothetical protein